MRFSGFCLSWSLRSSRDLKSREKKALRLASFAKSADASVEDDFFVKKRDA